MAVQERDSDLTDYSDEDDEQNATDDGRPDDCACTPPIRDADGEPIGGDLPCWPCWLAGYRSTPPGLTREDSDTGPDAEGGGSV